MKIGKIIINVLRIRLEPGDTAKDIRKVLKKEGVQFDSVRKQTRQDGRTGKKTECFVVTQGDYLNFLEIGDIAIFETESFVS